MEDIWKVDHNGERVGDFIISLGLYTAMAERILSDAFELMCNTKIFRGNKSIFSSDYGCFGLKNHNSFLNINDYGELSVRVASMKADHWRSELEKACKNFPRPTEPDFQKRCTEIIKQAVIGFLALFRAKQVYNPTKDAEDVIKGAEAIIKHFNGEELTNEELKWIGHPLNPFEFAEFDKIRKETYNTSERASKLRAYLKKVQKA